LYTQKKEECLRFLESIKVTCDKDNVHEHFNNPQLLAEVIKSLENIGKQNEFKGFEMIKKVHLTNDMFTIENDLLTPTMKLKRNEAKKRYIETIKKFYADK